MIVFLVAGIASLAIAGLQLTRPRISAERDRRLALAMVRTGSRVSRDDLRAPRFAVAVGILARVHRRIWTKQTPDDVSANLARAGVFPWLTAEVFMALRVALILGGMASGFLLAHGTGRLLLALVLAAAGVVVPGFLVSKAAARRAERIGSELPHFVDQLAIAVEAGMSFDAAINFLVDAGKGPLVNEMRRILTELRIGESRRSAVRNFALRIGTPDATAFANAVLTSDQLGSPLAGILHSQAADLRHRRQLNAEERAQKAPVKMLFPMVLFILPVMFVVILGPAFIGDHGVF